MIADMAASLEGLSSAARPDKRAIVAEHFLLHDLPVDRLDELVRYTKIQKHQKDDTIVRRGDLGTGMMAVISGRVKISAVSYEGKEMLLDVINPGEVFGEIALLDAQERTADAIALEETKLLVLERRHFLPFLDRTFHSADV